MFQNNVFFFFSFTMSWKKSIFATDLICPMACAVLLRVYERAKCGAKSSVNKKKL